jgi:tetratricopeptide (TPR) repeat protein
MTPAGRNDPCPCGSGLKYKKCCLIRQGNQHEPDELESLRTKAFKKMSEENWLDAIDLFKSVLEHVPDRHTILEAMAACYDGLENYLMAAEFYEKALAVCPESRSGTLHYRLGVSRACGERIERAAEAFRECLRLQNDPVQEGQLVRILNNLEEILQGKKSGSLFRVQVQLQRAFSDMEAEKYESAAARLERMAAIEPQNPAIFYNLGVAYTFLKREEEALAEFEKCLQLKADYVEAWYNMGQICMIKQKDFSRALHCFDQAATIRPDYIGAHHQRGVACELLGDRQRALECWEKTLELDPENKQARENIERLGNAAANQSCQ